MKYGLMPRTLWMIFHKSFEKAIGTVLHRDDGKMIMSADYKRYKEILNGIPEFDKEDRFLFNILSCAMFSGVYLSLPEKPDVDTMQEYYRTAMNTAIMRTFARKSGSYTKKGRAALKRGARWSQTCTNPYSWHYTVEDGATMNEYTATFTTCGILYLMRELGISEVTPALCRFDYDMAAMNNTVFTRKYTLAGGDDCCDCHYCHKG